MAFSKCILYFDILLVFRILILKFSRFRTQVRDAGNTSFWRRKRGADHIFHALLCPRAKMAGNDEKDELEDTFLSRAFARLWKKSIHFCLHEPDESTQDAERAVKVPHFVPDTDGPCPNSTARPLLAFFAGSGRGRRKKFVRDAFAQTDPPSAYLLWAQRHTMREYTAFQDAIARNLSQAAARDL